MKILFAINEWAMFKLVDAQTMFDDKQGLTGSETSIVMFAKEAAKKGHDVTLWGNFKENTTWCGVSVRVLKDFSDLTKQNFDIVFAWLHPEPLKSFPKSCRVLNQQVNDFDYCKGWEEYVDIVTSPSQVHKDYLSKFSNFESKRWFVMANGCDPDVFHPGHPSINRKMVYASSPDRGLHWILEAFPHIKKKVPDVTLDVFYDWTPFYERFKSLENEMSQRLRFCNEMFKRLDGKGVKHHKSVSKTEMVEVFRSSQVLAYPCDPVSFTEGFSVTTLEAAVAGCLPVICGSDALQSIYENYVPVVKAPYSTNKQQYIDTIVEMLLDRETYINARSKALELSLVYNWSSILDRFFNDLENLNENRSSNSS